MTGVGADMLISHVLSQYAGAAEVFERHGLGCAGCLAASMETLSAVSTAHDVDLEGLLGELNALDRVGHAATEGDS